LLASGTKDVSPFEAVITVEESNPSLLRSTISIDDYTGLEATQIKDPVISTRYYTLQGVEIKKPVDKGVYIVKKIHESQKQETNKIIYIQK
jgi:hypothetical protein